MPTLSKDQNPVTHLFLKEASSIYVVTIVCLGVEFLKSELNSYSICKFRGLTFQKR
jgi:hypothetical protein